jgi:hypothetical protein
LNSPLYEIIFLLPFLFTRRLPPVPDNHFEWWKDSLDFERI